MRLKKIALLDFKNIAQEELALCAGVNCLVGDNGAGKTNVVDAVYYLSMCKSSLQMTDGQSIRHGADFSSSRDSTSRMRDEMSRSSARACAKAVKC